MSWPSGSLSEHFSRHEVTCHCGCGFDTMDAETIRIAEFVRSLNGGPVTVLSGCRCEEHNREVGGAKRSQHVKARAMDLKVKEPRKIYEALCQAFPGRYGFGLYRTFVHVDSRTVPARWRG